MKKANYHTHTYRCKHAVGSDENYVLKAIEGGYKILGFSDHTPLPDSVNGGSMYRMVESELSEYLSSVRDLKAKYADQIEILVALEAEYFPKHEEYIRKLKKDNNLDYLILGNHFENYVSFETSYGNISFENRKILNSYLENMYLAFKSGLYDFCAHPDLICKSGYLTDENLLKGSFDKICDYSLEFDMPLEYNLSGLKHNHRYPNELLFRIAAAKGCKVIINSDAHDPLELTNGLYDIALETLKGYGCNIIYSI